MSDGALFSDEGLRVGIAGDERTAGQKLRDRQAARIALGCHPLSLNGVFIPLHPDAPRNAHKDDGGTYPRCGSCRHREVVSGRFPKCLFGYDGARWSSAVRAANSEATDVRAWWPACIDYAAVAS